MQNILIIEDNETILLSLSLFFRSVFNNYNILTAADGGKAIELLASKPVSLIVTDLEMPKVDGYQVIEYVKQNIPSIPLIIMTGWSLDSELPFKKTVNMRCIEKPFRYGILAEMAAEAMGESAASHVPSAVSPAERSVGF